MLYFCLVAFIAVLMFDFLNAALIQQIEAQPGPPEPIPPCNPQSEDEAVPRGRMNDTTDFADRAIGTNDGDTIEGKNGDDCLMGKSGDDLIEGGKGGDVIIGGDGNDELDGGQRDLSPDKFYCDATGGDIVYNSRSGGDEILGKCSIGK